VSQGSPLWMKIRPLSRFSTLTGYFHRRDAEEPSAASRNQKGMSFHDLQWFHSNPATGVLLCCYQPKYSSEMSTDTQPSKHKEPEVMITELISGTATSRSLKEREFLLEKRKLRRLLRRGAQRGAWPMHPGLRRSQALC
jgi:hypothetical protein